MRYHRPTSIDEVLRLLAAGDDARCLAGGATLVAMLNARLVAPAALVSLKGVPTLAGIRIDAGGIRIGAMTTHHAVATAAGFAGSSALVPLAAARIGHPAIRRMGTIGGSISHADPAADYPTALTAAEALVEIAGPAGHREVPAAEFFRGYFTTALDAGEIVVAVRLPASAPGSTGAYAKSVRVEGDFATASVAATAVFGAGRCTRIRIAVGGCGPTPVRLDAADALLRDSTLEPGRVAEAGYLLAQACDPIDDVRGSARHRRALVPRLLARVVADLTAKPAERAA